MFKSLIMRIAKSYIAGSINDFLYRNKDDAKKVSEQIIIWMTKLETILIGLDHLEKCAKNGKLDQNEGRNMMEYLGNVIKEFQ